MAKPFAPFLLSECPVELWHEISRHLRLQHAVSFFQVRRDIYFESSFWLAALRLEEEERPLACPLGQDLSLCSGQELRRIAFRTAAVARNWSSELATVRSTRVFELPKSHRLLVLVPGTQLALTMNRNNREDKITLWDFQHACPSQIGNFRSSDLFPSGRRERESFYPLCYAMPGHILEPFINLELNQIHVAHINYTKLQDARLLHNCIPIHHDIAGNYVQVHITPSRIVTLTSPFSSFSLNLSILDYSFVDGHLKPSAESITFTRTVNFEPTPNSNLSPPSFSNFRVRDDELLWWTDSSLHSILLSRIPEDEPVSSELAHTSDLGHQPISIHFPRSKYAVDFIVNTRSTVTFFSSGSKIERELHGDSDPLDAFRRLSYLSTGISGSHVLCYTPNYDDHTQDGQFSLLIFHPSNKSLSLTQLHIPEDHDTDEQFRYSSINDDYLFDEALGLLLQKQENKVTIFSYI